MNQQSETYFFFFFDLDKGTIVYVSPSIIWGRSAEKTVITNFFSLLDGHLSETPSHTKNEQPENGYEYRRE